LANYIKKFRKRKRYYSSLKYGTKTELEHKRTIKKILGKRANKKRISNVAKMIAKSERRSFFMMKPRFRLLECLKQIIA